MGTAGREAVELNLIQVLPLGIEKPAFSIFQISFLLIAPRDKTEAFLPLGLWQKQSPKGRAAHSPMHSLGVRGEALQICHQRVGPGQP